MEITNEMVEGYIGAVAAALEAAGHTVDPPTMRSGQGAELVLPSAAADEHGTAGLSLSWASVLGWTAAYVTPETGYREGHTDLQLGIVPEPALVVRAVEAIDANPLSLAAGRVVPGAAELLARYAAG